VFFEYYGPEAALAAGQGSGAPIAQLAAALNGPTDSEGGRSVTFAGANREPVYRAASGIGPILDCYENFKYGVVTLTAAAYVDSVSGATFYLGVNADRRRRGPRLICDGECPELVRRRLGTAIWAGSSAGRRCWRDARAGRPHLQARM
jgi:hypothetical protein